MPLLWEEKLGIHFLRNIDHSHYDSIVFSLDDTRMKLFESLEKFYSQKQKIVSLIFQKEKILKKFLSFDELKSIIKYFHHHA
jgi:hypothetical protein